jgi:arginine/lysine/ornithine decarboxylase
LRDGINKTGAFRVLELADMLPDELSADQVRLDPSKLSVDVTESGMTARQVQLELFDTYGIQVEKVTHNTLTVLVTLGSTESKVLRLLSALQKLAAKRTSASGIGPRSVPSLPQLSAFHALPRDAYFGPAREVSLVGDQQGLNEAVVGAISADLVVPYPPGIPVLIPGQEITESIARFLLNLYYSNNGTEIHGLVDKGDSAYLRVVR